MNTTTRYILLIAIWVVIFIGWEVGMRRWHPEWYQPRPATPTATNTPAPGAKPEATPGTPPVPSAPGTTPTPAPAPGTPTMEAEAEPEPNPTIDTPEWTAEVATRGGGFTSFVLKGRKNQARAKPGEQRVGVNLVEPTDGQPLPVSSELAIPGFGPDAIYKVISRTDRELVLKRTRGGVTVTRTLSWGPGPYSLNLQIAIEGFSGNVAVKTYSTVFELPEVRHWYTMTPRQDPAEAACFIKGERSVERRLTTESKPLEAVAGTPSWAGINHKYFLAGMAPGNDAAATTCSIGSPKNAYGNPGELVSILERTVAATPGTPASTSFVLYFGPKDMDQLTAADHDFDKSVDLGFFGIIGRWIILPIVRFFHVIGQNWGIAIILLTLLVKLATLPLTHKQMENMEVTRRLQPEVEKIKEKYAGDQQRVQLETMKLYQANNHNVLAGCVPMLVQLPIWYALYATLSASFELYNEPFIPGWLNDLTAIDPYYITPILMTATMLATQALTPQAAQTQPEMKYMMWSMPVIFGFFMLTLPSGLVLYIFTNNVLSIGQSLWFRRKFPPTPTPIP